MIEFYLIAVFIGLLVSLDDFKNGLIKNKYVVLLLLFGLVSKVFYPVEVSSFVVVLAYGLIVTCFFWLLGIWPAGDAKFFWALLFFLPPNLYTNTSVIWGFLVNSFVPVFFIMLFFIARKSKLGLVVGSLREAFNPYTVFMLFLMITGFLWVFQRAVLLLGFKVDFLVLIIALFLVFEFFRRYCTFRNEVLFTGLAVLRVLLDFRAVYSFSFLFEVLKFILVFVFFRFFIVKLAFKLYTRKVPINRLKEGLCPAEGIFKRGKKYEKESLISASFIGFMRQKSKRFIHELDCLSKKDVQKIKKLKKSKKLPFSFILVHQNQPFAIFLLIGFILTVLSSGSFFNLFKLL